MLTQEQVAKAKTFPGCNDLTAENAVDKLFAAADGLHNVASDAATSSIALAGRVTSLENELSQAKAAIPQPASDRELKTAARAAQTQCQAAVSTQAIAPAVATAMAERLIGKDDKMNVAALTPDASGVCLAETVFTMLAGNGRMPDLGKDAGVQPAPKVATGAPNETVADVTAKAREEAKAYQGAQLASRGMK